MLSLKGVRRIQEGKQSLGEENQNTNDMKLP